MDIRIGSKNGPLVRSVSETVEQIHMQIQTNHTQWLEQMAAEPGRLAEVEQALHQRFSQLADQLMATLLAEASRRAAAQEAQKKSWLRRILRFAHLKNAL